MSYSSQSSKVNSLTTRHLTSSGGGFIFYYMNDTRPVWLLDIDGVINAVAKKPDINTWPRETWHSVDVVASDGFAYPILYSTGVTDFIREMSQRVDIRWHTTWQVDALSLGEKLGLPVFPVASAPEFRSVAVRFSSVWWKIGAAERVVFDEERKLIWTDDDLWSEARNVEHIATNNCLVAPPTNTGLLKKHLNHILEWLDALGF